MSPAAPFSESLSPDTHSVSGSARRGAADPPPTPSRGAAQVAHPSPSLVRRDTTVIDLDAAISRITQLDDEHLEALVAQLDSALPDLCTGPADDDTESIVSVAGADRILLRQRRAVVGRNRAKTIVRQLISTTETAQ